MNGEKKKKRGGGGWAIAIIILGAILSNIGEMGIDVFALLIPLIGIAVIVGVFVFVFKMIKAAQSGGQQPAQARPMRREPLEDRAPRRAHREEERPVRARRDAEDRPSIFRREPLEDKPVSHQRELLPMDEYERQKRLNQLENFLKNGTIDREEYKKLRARYER